MMALVSIFAVLNKDKFDGFFVLFCLILSMGTYYKPTELLLDRIY